MRSRKAIYNITTNLILQVIIILYGFVVPKIIITKYGSNVNGLVSSITQFLAYITLLESGFGPVIKSVLYKPIARNDNETIGKILKTAEKFFRRVSYVFILYIIILCFLYPLLVNNNFDNLYTISLIIIISISIFFEYYFGMTYRLFLQAEQKTYVISIIQIITYILSIIFIVVLARFNVSIQIIKLVSGIIFVLRPILQNVYVKRKYNIKFDKKDDNYKLQQKWDGLAQHIASVIHNNTDITVLTIFSTLSEVSVYSVYYLVVKGIKSIIQAFTSGMGATFGDMIAKNENINLNTKFQMYEVVYFTICTIVFTCTMILIVPFISVYTKNITDANYIREVFGYLIVISEYVWAIRLPYVLITYAAGHFKETRIGAWVEAIVNIIISVILVNKYGIVGICIGTIIAMTIRTIEFIYHTNKYILTRNIMFSIKKIIFIIGESVICILLSKTIFLVDNTSYINWILNAFIIFITCSLVTFLINYFVYKKEIVMALNIVNNMIKKRRLNHENKKIMWN